MNEYKPNIPEQYQKKAEKTLKRPPQLGTIGHEKRWNETIVTPGVGDYDLLGFKCLNKASETNFEKPQSSQLRARSKSAYYRPQQLQ